ncbi:MAG: dienelactone hydrolase family protein [Acidimicrobiia bacterium]|jgi:dienelactone hydrolase
MSNAFDGFTASDFSHDGITRPVYAGGTGPAVIVIHEVPGLHPGVIDFGRRVVDRGFHVRMPSLFGTPGKPFGAVYSMRSMVSGCVAKEFSSWALDRTSPISSWLRALAADAHEACGGPGVGAVGMCFTGGFALGMMLDERMQAPVLSQPSLPFAVGKRRKASVGISDADLEALSGRAAAGACVMGLRFTGDPLVPAARFATLRDALGDGFIAVEIDSSKGNPHGIKRTAHSVLTLDLVDEPGHPTHDALERVLTFFDDRLR